MATLETLPQLVLDRICEYLNDDDDDDNNNNNTYTAYQSGSGLRALSLTSRQCCTATGSQRFCQLRMAVTSVDEMMRVLERWVEMLDRDGGRRYRYVRRLKVVLPGQDKVYDEWEEHRFAPWLSDLPRFCSPPPRSFKRDRRGPHKLESTTGEPWLALARFIGRLPALKDVVWGFCNMPRTVLAAIHATGTCRLHMHRFRLDSLVVHRNGPPQVIDIDPDEYALATSPALCSVVAKVRGYETDGDLNYGGEALMGMAAGAAPNLQHLWLLPSHAGNSLDLMQAVRLGKPPAPPDGLFYPKEVQIGGLRSLFCAGAASGREIEAWAARADFSKLCRLACRPWDSTWAGVLVGAAARGELASLKSLYLSEIGSNNTRRVGQLLTALNQNSLQSLSLDGQIHDALFDTILDRHGKSLRHLSLYPYEHEDYDNDDDEHDGDSRTLLFVLTPDLSARLAEKCPSLEVAELPMNRTLGDAWECAMYRGLGRLPRLKRLSLTLRFVVHPNEDVEDENEEPIYHGENIPRAILSQAFVNAAVDVDLARAIFDRLIASSSPGSSGSLEHLRLLIRRKAGRYAPASDDWRFGELLSWFARDWICERRRRSGDDTPVVEIREHDPGCTARAGKEWQDLGEGKRQFAREDVFVEAFGDVWPQTTPRWWEDWKSVPLCPDDDPCTQ
ncbi:hypothetical protein C8A05DRAFT_19859 [Staphylotrichum tortipilum]|uniref:Uncharacterized protein n=1 Tax=Staphylotrichum tortipilum TaxID=2831512 RepID=A0AAN6MC53_9PEZI|nr:hypothetical protein C8A05DRAFT_19859 [Staphylotrichum longicolle]